jgi:hypothetical protein
MRVGQSAFRPLTESERPVHAGREDVIMRTTTTKTALAVTGAALALPAATLAAGAHPPSPARTILHVPTVGHGSVAAQMQAARRLQLTRELTPRAVRLAGRVAKVRGVEFSPRAERRRLRGEGPGELRRTIRDDRRELAGLRRAAATGTAPVAGGSTASPNLQAIANCESGGDPSANTGNGFYGKYQFTQQTWASVGGSGSPAAASEAEQDARAAQLYAQSGSSPWPVCGR